MMKKLLGLLLVLALLVLPVAADGMDYVIDDARILRDSERMELETTARGLADRYHCATYIVTVEDYRNYGATPKEACRNIFEGSSFASATGGNAIMLLLSMGERDYYIQDFGQEGLFLLTDYGRETLEDAMLDDLAENDWAWGLADYLEQCETILAYGQGGEAFDEAADRPPLGERMATAYGIALVMGAIAALITCSVFKVQMKTAVKATEADAYVAPGGVNMRVRTDRYIHTTHRKRRINRDSGSRGGGSRSGGDSGGGGKF